MTRARLGALVLLALLVALGPSVGPAAARPDVPAVAGQTDPATAALDLVARSRWVPAEGTIEIDFTVSGDTEGAVLQLRVHGAVDSVEELERSLDEDVGRVLYRTLEFPVAFLPEQPDGSRRMHVAVSPTRADEATVRLPQPGVYPVSVVLEDGSGDRLDTIRTPVVRLGTDDDPLTAPDLALVLDVATEPSIEVDGRRDLTDAELDRLDRLAALLDGRAVGSPGTPLDATIAPSPDTVDALTSSADPRAARVLDALATTEGDRTVIGAPYVPLDVSALTEAGLDEFVDPVLETGRAVLADRIGRELDTTTWEVAGGIDASGAALLARLGFRHLLVDAADEAVEASPATERALIDAGPVTVPSIRPLEAVLVDTATSAALTARAVDRVDAGHIALAELIVRDAGNGSTVVVRADDAPEGSVLAALVPLVSDPTSPVTAGPLDPTTLVSGGDEPESPETVVPALEGGDADLSSGLTAIAGDVHQLAAAVDTFATLVGSESARADGLRLQLATSIARGIDTDRRVGLVESVRTAVDVGFDSVTLTGQTDLNLTSRSGTLPIMIRNDNEFPVRVVLRISSERLTFREGDRFEVDVTDEIARVDVPVDARATGSVPTFVQILTPDEQVVLDSRRLDVRSTAVSGVGLLLSAGALAVLVIWWARTWHRNRGDRRRA